MVKRSHIWFASVLIASALLLSTASNGSQNSKQEPTRTNPFTESVATETPRTAPSNAAERYDVKPDTQKKVKDRTIAVEIQRDKFDLSSSLFTLALVIITALQSALLWYNFQTQYRPRVGIRQVTLENDFQNDSDILFKEPICVGLFVVNRGASTARIVEGNMTILMARPDRAPHRNAPSMAQPYDSETQLLKDSKIKPATQKIARKHHPRMDAMEGQHFLEGETDVFVVGYFWYRDFLHRHYRTAFCRRFDRALQRFVPMKDNDAEYED